MFDLVIADHHTDRDLLIHTLRGLHAMALDFTKLQAAVAKLGTDVDALVVAHTDPAAQAAIDAATAALANIDAKAVAAVTPPAPAA